MSTGSKNRLKRITFNLFMLIIGSIALLLIGEAVVRVFYNKYSLYIPDPIFHHVHNKHFNGRLRSRKGEYNIIPKFNSYGYRDYEYPIKKAKGTTRLVVLGDSFVEAMQVELEHTFVKRLERKLNQRSSGQKRYEVMNFGMQAYSPILEYLVLKNTGLKFNPDLVIVCFYFNDIADDSIYTQKMISDKDGLPLGVVPEFLTRQNSYFFGKNFLRTHSRLYVLARNQYHSLSVKMGFRKNTCLCIIRLSTSRFYPRRNTVIINKIKRAAINNFDIGVTRDTPIKIISTISIAKSVFSQSS